MSTKVLSSLGQRTGVPPISWLMEAALQRPRLISLAAGFTDPESLPVRESRELFVEMLSSARSGRAALQYGTTMGLPRLRRLTARRWLVQDGWDPAAAEAVSRNLIITHGSQQLLYLVMEALCDPGDIVLVEDPTYFVFLGILQSHGVRCRGIRQGEAGMDLDHLREVLEDLRRQGELPRLKLIYLVSYFQNPTGCTTQAEVKRGILKQLRAYERPAGHRLFLLEDAAYRDLRFDGPDVTSAWALPGGRERVIYAGTYSKPFATGVRVGFGWLPEPLLGVVQRIKGNHDFGTTNLLQHLLARALETGVYERHLAMLRRRYAHKAGVAARTLQAGLPGAVSWRKPSGGLYFWLNLPARVKTGPRSRLFRAALSHDVLYVPGEFCYGPDPSRPAPVHQMRLSYGSASLADLREGIGRLGALLREHLDTRGESRRQSLRKGRVCQSR